MLSRSFFELFVYLFVVGLQNLRCFTKKNRLGALVWAINVHEFIQFRGQFHTTKANLVVQFLK